MLRKKQRIDRTAFIAAIKRGRRNYSDYFTLITALSKDHVPHISIVASKKAVGGSVARHRAVRRGYAVAGELLHEFIRPTMCIFYYKKGAHKLKHQELVNEMRFVLNNAGLIRHPIV
jgi:ribonuclease P protein component